MCAAEEGLEESLVKQASAAAGEVGSSFVLRDSLAAGGVGWLQTAECYECRTLAYRDGAMTV